MSSPVYEGLPVRIDPGCKAWTDPKLTPEMQELIETRAVWLLWALSGRQFGTEEITVRPVAPWPGKPTNIPNGRFAVGSGSVPPWWARLEMFGAGLRPDQVVVLPGPALTVTAVIQDGQPVDSFALFQERFLVRTDGGTWRRHQDLALPIDAEGSLAVTYVRGREWPASAEVAAGILCCEMAKQELADESCRLSDRVRTVTREGITLDVVDADTNPARTGVLEVDAWIASVNPDGIASPGDVWSPDVPAAWRVT